MEGSDAEQSVCNESGDLSIFRCYRPVACGVV